MTDRLAGIVIGLQRMGEAARDRGDDIKFTQDQEVFDHIRWLDEQLSMVEKVRAVLLGERQRFMPVSKEIYKQTPTQGNLEDQRAAINKVAMVQKTV
jgi:hypothetical protein